MSERSGERDARPADEPAPSLTGKARSDEWVYDPRNGRYGEGFKRGGATRRRPSPLRDSRRDVT